MIATILHSSPTFNAIYYNEKKVNEGVASLVELKNFGAIDIVGYQSPQELVNYLKDYTSQNDRIKNGQFHLAISCRGHEMTQEELLDFAHAYLDEMGYGQDGQPVAIYFHRDTDNNHLHIVTSRVGPDGKKINDSNERRRSQKVIDKLVGQKTDEKATKDINNAIGFNFSTVNQFKAIMEAMDYECFERENEICVKKGGMVQATVKREIIEAAIRANAKKNRDYALPRKMKAIFTKFRDMNVDKDGLKKDLRKTFGIGLVFFGSKDSPYGYVAVDFKNKCVVEGGKIMPVKELLNFIGKEERMQRVDSLIDACFDENPYITTKELNRKLRRLGAYVKGAEIITAKDKRPMKQFQHNALVRNNKIKWLSDFRPQTEEERDIICRMSSFELPTLINVTPNKSGYQPNGLSELRSILSIQNPGERKTAFADAGFRIIEHKGKHYAYCPKLNSIIDLQRAGIGKDLYKGMIPKGGAGHGGSPVKRDTPLRDVHVASGSANREWEVGRKGSDEDDPDRYTGMSY